MKRVRSFAVLVPSIALVTVAAAGWFTLHAGASSSTPSPALDSDLDPADGAIKQAMEQMNDAMKTLSKGITADNKAAALDELTKFETAVIAAKSQTPGSAAKVDEKKRAAFVADYRKTLLEALKDACDAESAIADGKYKDADKLINNKLSGVKSAGHSKFKEEGGGK